MKVLHSEYGYRVRINEVDELQWLDIDKLFGSSMACMTLSKEQAEVLYNKLKAELEPVDGQV